MKFYALGPINSYGKVSLTPGTEAAQASALGVCPKSNENLGGLLQEKHPA